MTQQQPDTTVDAELVPADSVAVHDPDQRPPLRVRFRGIYPLPEEVLERFIKLPPGQRIVAFRPDPMRGTIDVLAEGAGLPPVAEACEVPYMDSRWYSYDAPTVANQPPDVQHATVLAALEQPRVADFFAYRGRRRILERHRPHLDLNNTARCHHDWRLYLGSTTSWPCPDYLDAADGLVTGLTPQP